MKIRYLPAIALFLGASATLLSHPHLNKMVKATLPSKVEASIQYYTVPANMEHVKRVKVGDFIPSRAVLSLSGDTAAGSTTLKAGDYTIGAVRNAGDWTLALYPGKPARGMAPDKSKVIALDSSFSDSEGNRSPRLLRPGAGPRQAGRQDDVDLALWQSLPCRSLAIAVLRDHPA